MEAAGSGRLPEEAILPTWLNQRAVTFWDFNYIWICLAVVIVMFQWGQRRRGRLYHPHGPRHSLVRHRYPNDTDDGDSRHRYKMMAAEVMGRFL